MHVTIRERANGGREQIRADLSSKYEITDPVIYLTTSQIHASPISKTFLPSMYRQTPLQR